MANTGGWRERPVCSWNEADILDARSNVRHRVFLEPAIKGLALFFI
jgi:hypothetical protein